jgi:peptidoglycan/LPS O-acetylase OafA/YrhL
MDAQKTSTSRMGWVDAVKGLALLWIVTNHVTERVFGSEYIGNPSANWPALADRLAQLAPMRGFGVFDVPLNLLRYIGWTGDAGVGLFLLISGFGLTFGLLAYGRSRLDLPDYYRRRALRIYPLWWTAHIAFALTWLFTGWGIAFTHKGMLLSMLGVRFTPGLFDFFSPSWWFIGLLIQLYLIYPLLWWALRSRGPLWLFCVSAAVAIAARFAGLLVGHAYMPEWERGAFFLTRLPEFVAGMSLAAYWISNARGVDARLRSPGMLALGIALFVIGIAVSITLLGNAIAPLLSTTGSFVIAYALACAAPTGVSRGLQWTGKHSYSLYLVHQPLIILIVPAGLAAGWLRTGADVLLALCLSVLMALALEAVARGGVALIGRWLNSFGTAGLALRLAGVVGAALAVLAGAELIVERFWPQEVYGWGERASLQADPQFGWRLAPGTSTRLRWMGYDYSVVANELGFPAPSYPVAKAPGTCRILTVGDAFTSAEGVDTDRSWPRLLEDRLNARPGTCRVQVLNFAITGYGPDQIRAVLTHFVPRYRPDLVIVGFFVKDYGDVLRAPADAQASIGFDLPPLPAWKRVLLMYHARRLLQIQVLEPLAEIVTGAPRAEGYALGNFTFFERRRRDLINAAPPLVQQRLAAIEATDKAAGARTVILMIPASIQVCGRQDLAYYPSSLDTRDAARFDMDRPQRTTQTIAARIGVAAYDLRTVLSSLSVCPYQRYNMHWTVAGHEATAEFLSHHLVADHYLPQAVGSSMARH